MKSNNRVCHIASSVLAIVWPLLDILLAQLMDGGFSRSGTVSGALKAMVDRKGLLSLPDKSNTWKTCI